MRTSARFFPLLSLVLLPLLLGGCPTLKMGKVGLLAGSVSPKGFTMTIEVHVDETDETEGEGQQRQTGKGLIALNLPPGWKVDSTRLKSPFEDSVRSLSGLPQAAASVSEAFPEEAGYWWAFGSNTISIPKGSHHFSTEIAVTVPKRTKSGQVSVLASVLSDDFSDLPAPQKFTVEIKGRKGKLVPLADEKSHLPEEQPKPEGADEKGSAG